MLLQLDKANNLNNPINELILGLERWCIFFNRFAVIFFWYIKYLFGFILIMIGILTLLKLRGIYKIMRLKIPKNDDYEEDSLKKQRLILGISYIVMGSGIIFNFFTYFLIIILDPLPDRLIFEFINFSERIDTKDLNRIEDLNAAKYPHETTIYYCVAFASFGALLDVYICIYSIINNNGINKKNFEMLFGGIIVGILAGWTTCLPLLL